MEKLSVSIMAHPSREKHFDYLKRELGSVPFAIDDGRGLWENCKHAWQLHNPEAQYHIVIQDDAIICKDFRKRADEILKDDRYAYNFYYGHRVRQSFIARNAEGLKNGFLIDAVPHWGLAICLPVKLIDGMIRFADKLKVKQDDERIAQFLKSNGTKIYFPIPSLIEHRWWEHSLVGNVGNSRRALKFIDGDVEFMKEQ
jgi:hypothetical protein